MTLIGEKNTKTTPCNRACKQTCRVVTIGGNNPLDVRLSPIGSRRMKGVMVSTREVPAPVIVADGQPTGDPGPEAAEVLPHLLPQRLQGLEVVAPLGGV